jgi:signal peptidase II
MQGEKKYRVIGAFTVLFTVVFDQITKHAILAVFKYPPRRVEIAPFFDLALTWNKGVSFGLFNSYGDIGTLVLIIVSLAISLGLTIWLMRATNIYLSCGLGLIIGGAIGNLVDRFQFKAVVDFLYFHLDTFAWPAFNVADASITIGVALILFESFYKKGEYRV